MALEGVFSSILIFTIGINIAVFVLSGVVALKDYRLSEIYWILVDDRVLSELSTNEITQIKAINELENLTNKNNNLRHLEFSRISREYYFENIENRIKKSQDLNIAGYILTIFDIFLRMFTIFSHLCCKFQLGKNSCIGTLSMFSLLANIAYLVLLSVAYKKLKDIDISGNLRENDYAYELYLKVKNSKKCDLAALILSAISVALTIALVLIGYMYIGNVMQNPPATEEVRDTENEVKNS